MNAHLERAESAGVVDEMPVLIVPVRAVDHVAASALPTAPRRREKPSHRRFLVFCLTLLAAWTALALALFATVGGEGS